MSFFDSYPGLKRQLSALLSPEESPSDSLLALQTVGHLCRNPAHRAALLADNNPEFLSLFYARLHDLVLNNRGDLRADGLAILAEVAESDDNEGSAEIFGRFGEGEEAASLLMKYAQMPFENVSVMSYEVLLRMARNKWGLQKIDNQVRLGLLLWHVLLHQSTEPFATGWPGGVPTEPKRDRMPAEARNGAEALHPVCGPRSRGFRGHLQASRQGQDGRVRQEGSLLHPIHGHGSFDGRVKFSLLYY